jgi:hypothetical protein
MSERGDFCNIEGIRMTKKVFIAKREKKRIFERVYEIYSKRQGCQIFLVTTYQNWGIYNKLPHNIPNVQNIPIGRKIDKMFIKYANVYHCRTLQNLPKLGFLV